MVHTRARQKKREAYLDGALQAFKTERENVEGSEDLATEPTQSKPSVHWLDSNKRGKKRNWENRYFGPSDTTKIYHPRQPLEKRPGQIADGKSLVSKLKRCRPPPIKKGYSTDQYTRPVFDSWPTGTSITRMP